MTFRVGNLVKETTTTTGTGDLTLAGASTGYRAFSAICSDGDTVVYAIGSPGDAEREVGLGTWHTGNTLTRTTILESTNGNSVVSLSAGTKSVSLVMPAEIAGTANNRAHGRLTLTSGLPVTPTDVTAATSVYFTPYLGNEITLYTGSLWRTYRFTELTFALGTLTSGANYFLLVWDNAGTLTLSASPAWTGDNTIGTGAGTAEYELFEGVYVNKVAISGGPGARAGKIVGTFRTTSTTTTEDSEINRFLANLYNPVFRVGRQIDATSHVINNVNRTWRAGTQTRTTWVQMFARPVWFHIAAEVDDATGGSSTYLVPLINGVQTTGADFIHRKLNSLGSPFLEVWQHETVALALAGYNYVDVGEAEFNASNVTLDQGKTLVQLWQ